MTGKRLALPTLALFAAATLAAPPGGGNAGAGGWRGGGWSGNHGGHGHWRGSVGIYYGPYWGWGWPGYYGYWPGYYGYYWPGYYYNYGYAYAPYGYASYGYVPPRINGGVTYIEHEPEAASNKPAPVHVPDGAASAPPRGTQWWYLCDSPRGAYPYVRECPDGWERVPAVPPSGTIK